MKTSTLFFLALLYCVPSNADESVLVDRLGTEISVQDDGKTQQVTVTESVEIEAPSNQTISIYVQWFDEKGYQLKNGKKGLFRLWKHTVIPARSRNARPNDKNKVVFKHVDVQFTFDDFNECRLAPNEDVLLYTTCEIWWSDKKKYVGRGWKDRTPMIVRTDANGSVVEAIPFATQRYFKTVPYHRSYQRVAAREMTLNTKHLRLKSNVKVYETMGEKHTSYPVLSDGKVSANLRGLNRGYFFENIETEAQALELARLSQPNATILNSKKELESIISNLRKVEDWDEKKWVVGSTDDFKTYVKRIPRVGFEVHSVYIRSFHDMKVYREIVKSVTSVTFDGRTSEHLEVLLRAPAYRHISRPSFPGEKAEFGLVGFKPSGSPISDSMDRRNAATNAYGKAIRKALSDAKVEVVGLMVKQGSQFTVVPGPHDVSMLIKDKADWPEEE